MPMRHAARAIYSVSYRWTPGVKKRSILGLLGVALSVAGCAVGPDYAPPDMSVPGGFLAHPSRETSPASNAASVDLTEWWRMLHDRQLNSLVARALDSNLDLEAALTRVQAARALVLVQANQALPEVDAGYGAAAGTGTDNTKAVAPAALRAGDNAKNLDTISQVGGLDAGWELDLFGKVQRAVEARTADAEALKDSRDWLFAIVAADVARAYLDMRAHQRELVVLGRNIDAARRNLDLAQTRFNRGLTNELDVKLAQRQLATLQADTAPLAAQVDISRHAIAVLMGQFPEQMARELTRSGPMPTLPARIPLGLPVDLLRRRPDIREAERKLAASNALVGVAIAQLFPTVTLIGGGGGQGGITSSAAVPMTWIGAIGPSVTMPVLDFGGLDAQIEIADLKTRGLFAAYKQAILTAVQQVDDAAASYHAQLRRLADLNRALDAALDAAKISSERYDRGLTDFLNVLDAERALYDIEERNVVARQAAADQFVALCKALGGGWPPDAVIPALPPAQPALIAATKYLQPAPLQTR
jgi:NodT family efflux transporter outer membrane factor (OMF) lipoprotein